MRTNSYSLHYNREHCEIYFLPKPRAVWIKWKGFANHEQFVEACLASLDLLSEKRSSKIIADNRLSKVVSPQSQQWLNDTWFPLAYRKGYRSSAVIVSENIFNQSAVKSIVNKMDNGIFEVQYFSCLESAQNWLMGENTVLS